MSTPLELHWRDFPLQAVTAAKGDRLVSVCLPARNEAASVGPIVETIGRLELIDEILVVDDGSTDATARVARAAGATVVATDASGGRGKGEALWTAVRASKGDVVAFCDADLRQFKASFVLGLVGPLLADDRIGFVKGRYRRGDDGGRVTELVGRPVLSLLFPHLTPFVQPLAGEFAGRRDVLEQVPFVQGYGVDLALLVDVVAAIGLGRVAQVDLGTKRHRNRPLAELAPQAFEVLQAALHRAGVTGVAAPPERPAPASVARTELPASVARTELPASVARTELPASVARTELP